MLKTWKERRLYYFTCQGCAKRRSSLKRSIARAGKCRKCRRNKVPDNQPSLFSQTISKMNDAAGQIMRSYFERTQSL